MVAHWPEIASPEENPPVESPPVESPPVESPPVESPPVESPPVNYSPAEVEECLDRNVKQKDADDQMQQVLNCIGTSIEGWVSNEEFESARDKAKILKGEMAEAAETEEERREFDEHWPFQDHEEID